MQVEERRGGGQEGLRSACADVHSHKRRELVKHAQINCADHVAVQVEAPEPADKNSSQQILLSGTTKMTTQGQAENDRSSSVLQVQQVAGKGSRGRNEVDIEEEML